MALLIKKISARSSYAKKIISKSSLFVCFLLIGCGELSSNSFGAISESSCDATGVVDSLLSSNTVFVGDMILPIEFIKSREDLHKYWPEKALAHEESTVSSLGTTQNTLTTWDDGIIPLAFNSNISQSLRDNVFAACDILATHADVSCVERTNEFFYVTVSTEFSGCFATVGRTRNGIINLEGNCDQETVILHELMHVYGVMHEQQHPERDQVVRVIEGNIQDGQEQNFTLLDPGGATTDFDVDSIMLYTSFAFAIGQNSPTIVKRSAVCDLIENSNFPPECLIPYNFDFSQGDSDMITLLYGPSANAPVEPPTTPDDEDPPADEPEACFFNS